MAFVINVERVQEYSIEIEADSIEEAYEELKNKSLQDVYQEFDISDDGIFTIRVENEDGEIELGKFEEDDVFKYMVDKWNKEME